MMIPSDANVNASDEALPVAHHRDGCDLINTLFDPEKRLRMYIASICTLGVNSFPRISLGIRFKISVCKTSGGFLMRFQHILTETV